MIRTLALLALVLPFSFTQAAEKAASTNALEITNARIFTPMKGMKMTAGYGDLKNTSDKPLTVKVLDAKGFKAVELHESSHEDGKMKMKKVEEVKIEPTKTFSFKPGSYHLMFFGADPSVVKEGEMVPVEFDLNGTKQVVEFKVMPRTEMKMKK
jgi:copper(I)-binding protein